MRTICCLTQFPVNSENSSLKQDAMNVLMGKVQVHKLYTTLWHGIFFRDSLNQDMLLTF